jgi:hypothetical protein
MTDLMKHLESARPSTDFLESHLPQGMRDRIAARLSELPAAEAAPRRRRTALVAAAVVVAGVVVGPSLLGPDSSAAHADLTAVALAAANAEGPVIAEGTFLHVKTEAVQRNSRIWDDGRTLDTNREEWIRWDGQVWAVDTRPSAGYREYHLFPPLDYMTPEHAASLPDTAPELRAFLDRTVSGSNSHEEAIFVAITDWARSNLLPPRTLAAALEVLADVDGVSTKDVTVGGRDAVEVSFHRFWVGLVSTESMTIDRLTGRVLSEHDSDPTGSYDVRTTLVEVVAEVPEEILDLYELHGNGARVYDDGHAPTTDEM